MSPSEAPNEAALRELARFDAGEARVVSFYLDTDGRRYPRPVDYERFASDLIRRAKPNGLPRAAKTSVQADLDRIGEFVTKDFKRSSTRGLVIFACSAAGLWEEFRLRVPVRSRVAVDRHPHLLRLEAVLAVAERFATVLVGRERARIFLTRLGSTVERSEVLDDVPGKHRQGGWSQARYSRHIEELAHRHFKHTAEVLFALSKREPFDRLVLAGPEEIVASFEKELHPWLFERVCGRISLPLTASKDRICDATIAVETTLESERAQESVARVLEEFAAGRHAVVGLMPTLAALQESRVEVLAVGDVAPRPGVRCPACGLLALEGEKCEACGSSTVDIGDLYEEMVDEALRRRCRVVPAETQPLPEGTGALLRF